MLWDITFCALYCSDEENCQHGVFKSQIEHGWTQLLGADILLNCLQSLCFTDMSVKKTLLHVTLKEITHINYTGMYFQEGS